MGREIRMVPEDWEHPKDDRGNYQPLMDKDYDDACAEWYKKAAEWTANPMEPEYKWFHDWDGNPPDQKYYRTRKWTEAEATHFQVYETVSEGTPVTPHFATKEELVDYLVANGDFWDQSREEEGYRKGPPGWSRKNAESFVNSGFAMTGIITGGKLYEPREQGDIPESAVPGAVGEHPTTNA